MPMFRDGRCHEGRDSIARNFAELLDVTMGRYEVALEQVPVIYIPEFGEDDPESPRGPWMARLMKMRNPDEQMRIIRK